MSRARAEWRAQSRAAEGACRRRCFLDWTKGSANDLGDALSKVNGEGVKLTMISNRGVKVWPGGHAETFCSDHWRCRFLPESDGGKVVHTQVCRCSVALLMQVTTSSRRKVFTHLTASVVSRWTRENRMAKKPKAEETVSNPLVAVIMGSKSDWDTMRHADETLSEFGVAHECRVISAHRSPSLGGRVWVDSRNTRD
jgi:hypothetical protein